MLFQVTPPPACAWRYVTNEDKELHLVAVKSMADGSERTESIPATSFVRVQPFFREDMTVDLSKLALLEEEILDALDP